MGLLAALGRWGTQTMIASLLVGLALPPFASAMRPLLPWTVFVFLTLMFARSDLGAIWAELRRPTAFLVTAAWLVLVPPAILALGLTLIGRQNIDSGLVLGVAMQAAAPPLATAPAIAMLLGLRPNLILVAVLTTTIASAFVSPVLIDWVSGVAVPLDIAVLVRRLAMLIGGAMMLGLILRRLAGPAWLKARAGSLDGIVVFMAVIFGVAAMDGVLDATLAAPGRSLAYLILSGAIAVGGLLAAWIALRRLDPRDRLVIGYATGMRNASLQIAALGALVPDTTYLYFALSQIPIFVLPHAMRAVVRARKLGHDGG